MIVRSGIPTRERRISKISQFKNKICYIFDLVGERKFI